MELIDDPRKIYQNDMPFHFILSNQSTSLVAWAINWKTQSNFDHCMQSINAGKFITQDFGGYHEVPMDSYLKRGGELKFIKIINATSSFNIAFRSAILNRLAQPWYKKVYDYGNILGRAVGLNWIRLPGTYDCSEISLAMIKKCATYLAQPDCNFLMSLPDNASPDDIDQAVKNNPDKLEVYGLWEADEGIVV